MKAEAADNPRGSEILRLVNQSADDAPETTDFDHSSVPGEETGTLVRVGQPCVNDLHQGVLDVSGKGANRRFDVRW